MLHNSPSLSAVKYVFSMRNKRISAAPQSDSDSYSDSDSNSVTESEYECDSDFKSSLILIDNVTYQWNPQIPMPKERRCRYSLFGSRCRLDDAQCNGNCASYIEMKNQMERIGIVQFDEANQLLTHKLNIQTRQRMPLEFAISKMDDYKRHFSNRRKSEFDAKPILLGMVAGELPLPDEDWEYGQWMSLFFAENIGHKYVDIAIIVAVEALRTIVKPRSSLSDYKLFQIEEKVCHCTL